MTTKPEVLSRIEATFSQLTPSESGWQAGCWRTSGRSPLKRQRAWRWPRPPAGSPSDAFCASWATATDDAKSLRDPHQPGALTSVSTRKQQQPLSDRLQNSLSLEVDAIAHVYQLAQSETFRQVVQQLTHADAVFVLGIQSTRGIANAFFSHLGICARG